MTSPLAVFPWLRRAAAVLALGSALMGAHSASAQTFNAELWTSGSQVFNPGVFGPNYLSQPAGGLVIGPRLLVGTEIRGWVNLPHDPTGQLPTGNVFDTANVGQMAMDAGRQLLYWTQRDKKIGTVIRYGFDPLTGELVSTGFCPLAVGSLRGKSPQAVAVGPDGRLYVGLDTSGDIMRIDTLSMPANSCPATTATSIGRSAFGGRIYGLTFIGNDLYIAGKDGLGVIANAIGCNGACSAQVVPGGPNKQTVVGLTSDGVSRLYYAYADRIWTYPPATGGHVTISLGGVYPAPASTLTAYDFINGKPTMLHLDQSGNLWIGDDITGGVGPQSGRIWRIDAALLY